MLDSERIREIERMLRTHKHYADWEGKARFEEMEDRLKRYAAEVRDLRNRQEIINDRLDQHAKRHREISADELLELGLDRVLYARQGERMLRITRANGARFKIPADQLMHVLLYNGDTVEMA